MTGASSSSETGKELTLPAYTLTQPERLSAPALFASPHSGAVYPEHMLARLQVPLLDLQRTEDAFVDDLFSAAPASGAALIAANYARCYVDLNRDTRELDPDMFDGKPPRACAMPTPRVEAGLGVLPRVASSGKPLYASKIEPSEGERRLAQVHDAYHTRIRAELNQIRDDWGEAFLIDCHSMPSVQPGRRALPDIVLGDRFGSACTSHLTMIAERAFRNFGYTTARNAPYAGGYTTRLYGRPKSGIHALQIEINRGLYMNEISVEKSAAFDEVRGHLSEITAILIDFTLSRTGQAQAAE